MDSPQDTTMADAIPAMPSVPLFRPNKKRKIYRQRAEEEDEAPVTNPEPETIDDLIANARSQAEEKELAQILKLRKQKKSRSGGVEFRAEGLASRKDGEENEEERDLAKMAELEVVQKVVGRFAPPKGGVMGGESYVDKHMATYIDSRLAKGRFELGQPNQDQNQSSSNASDTDRTQTPIAGESSRSIGERQPAMLGKLQEIDLGDEVREYNMSRTQQRLNGQSTEEEAIQKAKESPKPRPGLGPDGKPWRPRKNRGRNIEDVRRDALVDEVLRENRIELYEEVPGFAPGQGIYNPDEEDGAADDRIAEEFKREFMDAVNQRQRKRPTAETGKKSAKLTKEEELMKGPKLGGSKTQRAAMREMVLKGEIPPPRVGK